MNANIRCGTDLVEIRRISDAVSKHGPIFLNRIWTLEEQADCLVSGQLTAAAAASLAVRFAAKEAAAKALGTGIGREGVRWTDLVVVRRAGGAPEMQLHGAARRVFAQMGGRSIAISLSHERQMALAFCILTCEVENSES